MPSCPSYRADDADSVIGVVGGDGRVGFVSPALEVTPTLLARLRSTHGPLLEDRFRFAGPCQESACSSWRGDHCGVIETALDEIQVPAFVDAPLAHCAVRASCRWWLEHGRHACAVCPMVSTATAVIDQCSESEASPGPTDSGQCNTNAVGIED